jgi:hypothetical protein
VHAEVGLVEPILRLSICDEGGADVRPGRVAKENKLPTWTQQAMGFRDPDIGVRPDGGTLLADAKVEARIRLRHLLSDAVDPFDSELILASQHSRRIELFLRRVDADDVGAAPLHPVGDITGATAQVNGVESLHVLRQQGKLGIGNAPYTLLWGAVPGPAPRCHLVVGILIPVVAI